MDLKDLKALALRSPVWFKDVVDVVSVAATFGTATHKSGALTLGYIPDAPIGSSKWFHTLYPGINLLQFQDIHKDFGLRAIYPAQVKHDVDHYGVSAAVGFSVRQFPSLPSEFLEFLSLSNGCRLFSGNLSVRGVRMSVDSDLDNLQPIDLSQNLFSRPKHLRDDEIVVGGYDADGSYLVLACLTGQISRRERATGTVCCLWSDFPSMLVMECHRMASLFDPSSGRLLRAASELLPVVGNLKPT